MDDDSRLDLSDAVDCGNEKYNLSCPYNPEVKCVQMPCDDEVDDNLCSGCPNKGK